MLRLITVTVIFITLAIVENKVYLHNTNDGLEIQHYDCVLAQSLLYCRRPKEPINLTRDNDNQSCTQNGGQLHRFGELQVKNITVSTVLHQWRSTLERVEQYSSYLKGIHRLDGCLCQCLHPGAFGKNCEYQLSSGETFEETLIWQLTMRENNPQPVPTHSSVVCYETLGCHSGLLCLDWREICDGIQNCLEGRDEENCDLLEVNQCDSEDEYRCSNGMCIPDEFFLDGELDCLDWSDEMQLKNHQDCSRESVNALCDDHLCPPNQWSCGDGECISDRLAFLGLSISTTCASRRDHYFTCETYSKTAQWTMPNGRCYRGKGYVTPSVMNDSAEELCKYLLKCALSGGAEKGCLCNNISQCVARLQQACSSLDIEYPRGAVVTPYTFFFYNRTRNWSSKLPDFLLINGTVRCRGSLVSVTKFIPFDVNLDARRAIENHFCRPFLSNSSSLEIVPSGQQCHHVNESIAQCSEWNQCLSLARIKDGYEDCLNGRDELDQTQTEIEKSCARVRRHRFRCSVGQPTCLSVARIGDGLDQCRNGRDELWTGMRRPLFSIRCNGRSQDECSLLRQYIDQSSKSFNGNEVPSKIEIPFRSYCDTFDDLEMREDENLLECDQQWVCSDDHWRCQTGQCIDKNWFEDWEWDCPDASDEHGKFNSTTQKALQAASRYNFANRSYFIPSTCPQSHPFLCLSANATRQGFSCFNLSQIGDGHIDCAGAQDERNTLQGCSSSSILGYEFLCASTNHCVPYYRHCLTEKDRCLNRSDDQHWCDRQHRPLDCSNPNDFICFDGECIRQGRCNWQLECPFAEDEYMCDYESTFLATPIPYRKTKRFSQGTKANVLQFSPYPVDANITRVDSHSITEKSNTPSSSSSSLLSPYWCNRGLGVLMSPKTDSIVCFCPPQYYGDKCEYHSDRLSVVLHLDLSQSTYDDGNHPEILLKLVVLFVLNGEVLDRDQFHLHPSSQITDTLKKKKKFISHFVYPRSFLALKQRRQRFFNRSSLLDAHRSFSIRVELYQIRLHGEPALIAVWNYPISFDYLPVSRLAQILRLSSSVAERRQNPCSSRPCHPNEQCHPLMNNKSQYICLCQTNFTGKNCSEGDGHCVEGYCASESLCQANSQSALPFCLCPSNRYGQRCSIEHDLCFSNPCLNNGSCFPDSQPSSVICLCTREYSGNRCERKRASIHLSLSTNLPYLGAVTQFFDIDTLSLDLLLLDQQVFKRLPPQIDYYHRDQTTMTGVVLIKIYSSPDKHSSADLHLLSLHLDVFSLIGTTEISPIDRCSHLRSFANSNFFTSLQSFRSSFFSFRFFTYSISSDLSRQSSSSVFPR